MVFFVAIYNTGYTCSPEVAVVGRFMRLPDGDGKPETEFLSNIFLRDWG